MPVNPTYPGVYIEEIPSGVRTIVGVATSITAFIGMAFQGPTDTPVRIQSFADFERQFGGLWAESTMGFAVQQYFLNGGTDAIIVRIVGDNARPARFSEESLNLVAVSEGKWGDKLGAKIEVGNGSNNLTREAGQFNLRICQTVDADGVEIEKPDDWVVLEVFRNLSAVSNASEPRYVGRVLEQESTLVRLAPSASFSPSSDFDGTFANGNDGTPPGDAEYKGDPDDKSGIYALKDADLFNLLCIIPPSNLADENINEIYKEALPYCKSRRAMLIVDPPGSWNTVAKAETGINTLRDVLGGEKFLINAAVFFPRLRMPNQLQENRLSEFIPCGVVAGIMASTDLQRGVWKAPAGTGASLLGVRELSTKMTDGENGRLNPLGVNCIRNFPVYGNVVWGSRTLAGDDRFASEWKYIPVRRLALFIEESLIRGTKWCVFEPNDEPLWAQIRLNIGAFMQNLFRQGAFQGQSPNEAYFVKCDSETTTQNDINRGIVNISVGFAPLKPAEFVIIKIQQLPGQNNT
ncbi:MAG: phage tail sheath C-terminal domain-containing protein [Cyanobacteria bacterium P01_G01_bin.67]